MFEEKMVVTFDDGSTYTVQPKPRDMALAEQMGYDFDAGGPMTATWAVALAGLVRMQGAGLIPADVELPGTVPEFIALADVESEQSEDPEGKDSSQAPQPG